MSHSLSCIHCLSSRNTPQRYNHNNQPLSSSKSVKCHQPKLIINLKSNIKINNDESSNGSSPNTASSDTPNGTSNGRKRKYEELINESVPKKKAKKISANNVLNLISDEEEEEDKADQEDKEDNKDNTDNKDTKKVNKWYQFLYNNNNNQILINIQMNKR